MKPSLVGALVALGPWRSTIVIVVTVLSAYWLALAVTFGLIPVGPGLTNRLGGVAAGDFMFFYPAGVLAGRGHAAAVYDSNELTSTARATLGLHVPDLVWPYPPTMSLPLSLLGRLPPAAGLAVWIGVSLTSLLALSRLALGQWPLAPVALLCPASALALFTGQFSPVLALLLGLIFVCSARSALIGGVALGLLFSKPHFSVIPAAFALARGQRRMLIAAAATGGAVVGLSLVAFGVRPWMNFFEAGVRHTAALSREVPMARLVTTFGAAYTAGAPGRLAMLLHTIAAAFATGVGWRLWKDGTRPSLRALGLTGATLQFTPYALDYDLVFLLLPWLLIIRECREDNRASILLFWTWLGLTVLVPVSYMTQLYTGRSVAGPLLLAILVFSWRRRHAA